MRDHSDYRLHSYEVYPRQEIKGFQISPDGNWVTFLSQRDLRDEESGEDNERRIRNIALADLYLIPSSGGFPQPLTNTGDVVTPGVWSPDGSSILFGRKESLEIITLEHNADRPGIVSNTTVYQGPLYGPKLSLGDEYLAYPRWRPREGDYILFVTRDGDSTTLRAVTAEGNLQRKVYSSNSPIVAWDWSFDGQSVLLVTKDLDRLTSTVSVLDFDLGEIKHTWETKEEHYNYGTALSLWTPDARQVVLRSNRSGWTKLWISSPDGSNIRPLTHGEFDDNSFRLSPDGSGIVHSSRREGITGSEDLWISSLSGDEPRRITSQSGMNVPLMWFGERIYYWHSSPEEPGDLWSVAIEGSEKPMRLTFSASPELARKLSAPQIVNIQNDETTIPTLIYFPKLLEPGQKYPAILWIRGGPAGACRFEFKPIYNFLANLGFIVVSPNYRGSIGCGVAYMSAVVGEGAGKRDLSDIAATAEYIRSSLEGVDLSRGIGIGGHSWGGYLTLMAITSESMKNEFSCAAAGAAISDWIIQQSQTDVRWYDYWLMQGWTYELNERVSEQSPVSRLDQISVPLFVYHGEADRNVPFLQMKEFVDRAKAAGKNIEHVFHPGEGHNPKKAGNQAERLRRIGDFFRMHLQRWNFTDNPCGDQEI